MRLSEHCERGLGMPSDLIQQQTGAGITMLAKCTRDMIGRILNCFSPGHHVLRHLVHLCFVLISRLLTILGWLLVVIIFVHADLTPFDLHGCV